MKACKPQTTRRHFIRAGATFAATWQLQRAARAAGFSSGSSICKLAAEQEEGPYYIADELVRSNIAEGRPGIPLSVRLLVLDARSCKPLTGAMVDVWHCDALGLYSGFTQQNPMGPGGPGPFGGRPGGPPPGPPGDFDPQHPGNFPGPPEGLGPGPRNHPTDKLTFLRGIQATGEDGTVSYRTIFPGFYMGRTNHIHFKVRPAGVSHAAGHTAHTGQLFFPEAITVELMQQAPYNLHKIPRTTQEEDHVFTGQHGNLFIGHLQAVDAQQVDKGMHVDLVASVDPTATPARAEPGGMPGPPPMHGL